jgi:ArsR family transcriptional regulator
MTVTCLCKSISDKEMEAIKADLPSDPTIGRLSDFFRVFGDGTRLKVLYYLSRHELCVADLAALVGMQQSAVSHQLKLLRLQHLVKYRKHGTTIYYTLDDDHVQSVFKLALEHVNEERER